MQVSDGRPMVARRGSSGIERRGGRGAHLLSLVCLFLLLVPAARAAAADRFALVLGEAAYQSLPREPGCTVSAQVIAGRLRALGFDVAAQTDASNGEIGAALIDLAHRAGAAVHPTLVVYFCGHAVAFDGRTFLLPVGTMLKRPSDALTEGLPAQSLLDIADRKTRAGLTVFDLYDVSPQNQPAAAAALFAGRQWAPGHVALAAHERQAVTTATPLAQALSAALAQPPVNLDQMIAAIRKDLAGGSTVFAASGSAGGATLVAAAPAAPPPAHPQRTAAKPAAPKPAAAAPAPVAAVSLPAESQYSVLDRRRVQAALRLLGYYNGMVDGIFGPQTRAAIQHYQHDAGVPVTGTLTPSEADRLVAGLPLTSR